MGGRHVVVDVTDHNDRTWFDTTGTFHSSALKVVERYTMTDPDTIQHDATIEDPKAFSRPEDLDADSQIDRSRPRSIPVPGRARRSERRFERDPKTWYPGQSGCWWDSRMGRAQRRSPSPSDSTGEAARHRRRSNVW
jgi:hypothetical protein